VDSIARSEWLRRLLLSHEPRLLRYSRRWVSEESSREVVQETFLRLWKEDPAKLENRETEWLFCVVRNLSIDVAKKENQVKKKTAPDGSDIVETIATDSLNADEALSHQQEENAVIRLITELPESQQEVMRLKFQEGFSYKEISSITGHSVSYVGVLIHEAMQKLKAAMVTRASTALAHGGER
jgi:RNA polymerase sigma factor (sigma-70 family)